MPEGEKKTRVVPEGGEGRSAKNIKHLRFSCSDCRVGEKNATPKVRKD